MAYFCGIDIGASAAKLVILDRDRQVVGRSMRDSGVAGSVAGASAVSGLSLVASIGFLRFR